MIKSFFMTGLLAVLLGGQIVSAQGVLLPHDHDHWHLPRPFPRPNRVETTYHISELSIDARIEDQVSRTTVTQTFVNNSQQQIEAEFVFPLPYDGAIDQMTFMVDGKEITGKLMAADEARRIYQGYLQRFKDPALLQWLGHGMFQTNVFPIPPGAKRTVTLKYTQLLRKDHNLTDYLFPLSTAKYTSKPIDTFTFRASIESQQKIKSIYSPTHDIDISRSDDKHAVVKLEKKNYVPSGDMRLMFDNYEGPIGASVISFWPKDENEDGYFLMLASPEIKSASDIPLQKTVVFVVDRSGSMNGKKMEQARDAAKFVLSNLREGDLFNIVAYDADIETFRPELQKYNSETAAQARGFIDGINAGGSTNIDGAMTTALTMIQDSSNPNFILFMTDGLPTAGEQNEAEIVKNSEGLNKHKSRIISFGVGFDVNSRLLDRLTRANRGQSQYVRPDENLEDHVSRLYDKISAPVMTDLKIAYSFDDDKDHVKPVNRIYPSDVLDIFAGQQLVLVGRYKKNGAAKIKITGKVGEQESTFDYVATFADKSSDDRFAFVAKLWAARRIGEIIDLIDLEGRNEELVKELVDLSTKHGIVTQYTAFLADPNAPIEDFTKSGRMRELAQGNLGNLDDSSGASGFGQRVDKQMFKSTNRAPQATAGAGFGGGGLGGQGDSDRRVQQAEQTVRQSGKLTLYKRGNVLIASNANDVDLEKDKDKITEITRFTDKYFELIAKTNSTENSILSEQADDEELIVRLQGNVYRIK